MKKALWNIPRWTLTTILLIIVQHHAHWSVAVSIGLLYVGGELLAFVSNWHGDMIRRINR